MPRQFYRKKLRDFLWVLLQDAIGYSDYHSIFQPCEFHALSITVFPTRYGSSTYRSAPLCIQLPSFIIYYNGQVFWFVFVRAFMYLVHTQLHADAIMPATIRLRCFSYYVLMSVSNAARGREGRSGIEAMTIVNFPLKAVQRLGDDLHAVNTYYRPFVCDGSIDACQFRSTAGPFPGKWNSLLPVLWVRVLTANRSTNTRYYRTFQIYL